MLVGATALALAPAALDRGETPSPLAEPSASPGAQRSASPGHTVIRTLDFGGLHLTYAEVDGMPGPLYLVVGDDLTPPADAEKLDLDTPGVDAWFVADPASGEPQLYVKPRDSSQLFGIYGQGWTREQLVYLLEHPLEAQGIKN